MTGLMPVMGALCLFAGLATLLTIIGVITTERRTSAKTLQAIARLDVPDEMIESELERPFAERVLAPLGGRMVGLGRRLTRSGAAARLQHKLDIAGNPRAWDVNRIIGLKALGLLVFGTASFLMLASQGWSPTSVVMASGLTGAVGYLMPNILLNNAGQKREQDMLAALPDAVDLLTISVEAGLGFEAAVARVARETDGPLALEFGRLLQEMQIGVGRQEAMRAMAERSTLKDFKSFCLAIVQGEAFGVGVANVLRVQSAEMRAKRRARAEEKAHQIPVKLLFPLMVFILPTVFIVILGPSALQVIAQFRS